MAGNVYVYLQPGTLTTGLPNGSTVTLATGEAIVGDWFAKMAARGMLVSMDWIPNHPIRRLLNPMQEHVRFPGQRGTPGSVPTPVAPAAAPPPVAELPVAAAAEVVATPEPAVAAAHATASVATETEVVLRIQGKTVEEWLAWFVAAKDSTALLQPSTVLRAVCERIPGMASGGTKLTMLQAIREEAARRSST